MWSQKPTLRFPAWPFSGIITTTFQDILLSLMQPPSKIFFFFNNYIILGAGQYQAWSTKILNFMWFVFLKHKLKCISSESFTKLYAGSYIYP